MVWVIVDKKFDLFLYWLGFYFFIEMKIVRKMIFDIFWLYCLWIIFFILSCFDMLIVIVNELDDILKELIFKNKKFEKILIGYKVYSEFMNDWKFLYEVVSLVMDLNKRKY